jgi:hypothetical protein
MRYGRVLVLAVILGGGVIGSEVYAQTSQEVRVRWDAYVGAPSEVVPGAGEYLPANVLTVIDRRQFPGSAPRQRAPELSSDQVLVVALDAGGQQRDWALIPDPRIIRAEVPGPSGELSGQVLHRSTAEFTVTFSDDPGIAQLRFYHPRWTGEGFALDLLGAVPLQ